uniref:Uncharacterized protein n=1 Tax=Arundo donax TaxID=35708 RepID=A0A0A9BU33_ARUDO
MIALQLTSTSPPLAPWSDGQRSLADRPHLVQSLLIYSEIP